jgi:hypothetical protein
MFRRFWESYEAACSALKRLAAIVNHISDELKDDQGKLAAPNVEAARAETANGERRPVGRPPKVRT